MYADPRLPSAEVVLKLNAHQIGRLNLLTPTRVKAAASEIQTGEIICLKYEPGAVIWCRCSANQSFISLPLHLPETPAFGREPFQHTIKTVIENYVYDDLCTP